MVNHIRTLLFNENSVNAESAGAPYVDPSFVPLTLSGTLYNCVHVLFDGDADLLSKMKKVDFCMSCMLSPEFTKYFEMFDTRVSSEKDERIVRHSTVAEFYEKLDASFDTGIVERALSSSYTQFLFQHVGDVAVDDKLDGLYTLYLNSFETWKRFTAFLYAVVIKLDFQYEASK